jgi:hypothetical protein
MEAVTRYDTQFQRCWYTQAFTISDPLWTSAPPADHFVPSNLPPSVKALAAQAPAWACKPASKRIKLGKPGQTADFICTTALIVPVEPLPSQKAAIRTILQDASRRFQARTVYYCTSVSEAVLRLPMIVASPRSVSIRKPPPPFRASISTSPLISERTNQRTTGNHWWNGSSFLASLHTLALPRLSKH